MNTNLLTIAGRLSDEALLAKVKMLAEGSREVTVELITHLAELDRRKLHRGEGPGKLFGYCREVWQRDGGQCAFVARNGRRCTERSYIEYHHEFPHSVGGEPTVDNISLRCREHNEYESELIFGPYDPSRVRETPPAYGKPFMVTGPGTSNPPVREMLSESQARLEGRV